MKPLWPCLILFLGALSGCVSPTLPATLPTTPPVGTLYVYQTATGDEIGYRFEGQSNKTYTHGMQIDLAAPVYRFSVISGEAPLEDTLLRVSDGAAYRWSPTDTGARGTFLPYMRWDGGHAGTRSESETIGMVSTTLQDDDGKRVVRHVHQPDPSRPDLEAVRLTYPHGSLRPHEIVVHHGHRADDGSPVWEEAPFLTMHLVRTDPP